MWCSVYSRGSNVRYVCSHWYIQHGFIYKFRKEYSQPAQIHWHVFLLFSQGEGHMVSILVSHNCLPLSWFTQVLFSKWVLTQNFYAIWLSGNLFISFQYLCSSMVSSKRWTFGSVHTTSLRILNFVFIHLIEFRKNIFAAWTQN